MIKVFLQLSSLLLCLPFGDVYAQGFAGMPFEQFVFKPEHTMVSGSIRFADEWQSDYPEMRREVSQESVSDHYTKKNLALTHSLSHLGLGLIWEESAQDFIETDPLQTKSTALYRGQGLALMVGDHIGNENFFLAGIFGRKTLQTRESDLKDLHVSFLGSHLRIKVISSIDVIPWIHFDQYDINESTQLRSRRGIEIALKAFGISFGIGDIVQHTIDDTEMNGFSVTASYQIR
jgi:hypothetical protein